MEDKLPKEELKIDKKEISDAEYKKEKYIALYQARTIIAKHGTMPERQLANKQLKRMRKLGAKAV